MPNETFLDRVIEAFEAPNAAAVARKLGVSRPTVSEWAKSSLPKKETLLAISEQTETSLHWLLTGEGPREIQPAIKTGLDLSKPELEAVRLLAIKEGLTLEKMLALLIVESLKVRLAAVKASDASRFLATPRQAGVLEKKEAKLQPNQQTSSAA